MEGYLKQQCIVEADGFYKWERKWLKLNKTKKTFSIQNYHNDVATNISLINGKYAKAWNLIHSGSESGFDLIWKSGKIWSFLTDCNEQCVKWISCFNDVIGYSDDRAPTSIQQLLRFERPMNSKSDCLRSSFDNVNEIGLGLRTRSHQSDLLLRPTDKKSHQSLPSRAKENISSGTESVDTNILQLKVKYEQREHETAIDLQKLEGLHEIRVTELQNMNLALQSQIQTLSRQLQSAELKILTTRESSILNDVNLTQQKAGMEEAERIRNNERELRRQLTEALEDNRILRAGNHELTRQVEAERERTRDAESRLKSFTDSRDSTDSALRIAQNEISMLENENSRLKSSNNLLTADLKVFESRFCSSTTQNSSPNNKRSKARARIDKLLKAEDSHSFSQSNRKTPDRVAFKWREGCVRSPDRCDASSLLLLPPDIKTRPLSSSNHLRDTRRSDSFLSRKPVSAQGSRLSVVRSASLIRQGSEERGTRSHMFPIVAYH